MRINLEFELPEKLTKKLTEMSKLWDLKHKSGAPWTKEKVCATILLDVFGHLTDRGHNVILGYETMHKNLDEAYQEML